MRSLEGGKGGATGPLRLSCIVQRWYVPQHCCPQELENKLHLMNSWILLVISRQNVKKKKKVSVDHLFILLNV